VQLLEDLPCPAGVEIGLKRPDVNTDRRMAIEKYVVLHQIVPPAVKEHADIHVRNNIPENGGVGTRKVEIDSPATSFTDAVYVMDIVVANDSPHLRIVRSRVDPSNVAGFMGEVIELVVFNQMIVAVVLDCGKGGIVDPVVGYSVAHPLKIDPSVETLEYAAIPGNVVVNGIVAGGRNSGPFTPDNPDAGPSYVVYIAAPDAVPAAAFDDHARVVIDVPDCASGDQVVAATPDLERACARAFEN
jgi:hypothetical protein